MASVVQWRRRAPSPISAVIVSVGRRPAKWLGLMHLVALAGVSLTYLSGVKNWRLGREGTVRSDTHFELFLGAELSSRQCCEVFCDTLRPRWL